MFDSSVKKRIFAETWVYHELHESYKYYEHETVNDSGTDDGDDRLGKCAAAHGWNGWPRRAQIAVTDINAKKMLMSTLWPMR